MLNTAAVATILGDDAVVQYRLNGAGAWIDTVNTFNFDVVAGLTQIELRILDNCDATIQTNVITVAIVHNVPATDDITIESAEDFDFCIPAAVTAKSFTAKIGTIGTNGQLQWSTDNATWFNTSTPTNNSPFTIADITSVTNVYVQLINACNAGSIASVDSTVNVSIQVTGDADISTSATLQPGDVSCGDQLGVSLDFDANNDVTLAGTSGAFEYVFTGPNTLLDWNNATSTTTEGIASFDITQDTTINVRLVDCSGVVSTATPLVIDYKVPTDVSTIVVTSEYGVIGSLVPVPVTPICIGDDVYVSVSNYTIGDGATLQYSLDAGGLWTNVVDDTVKILDIQVSTTVDFQVIGSCNIPAAIPSSTINVYGAIPAVTSLTIDKDNLCANDEEVVRLTAFTTAPIATPYIYEWSKYKASNNTYTVIAGAPNAAIFDVIPDTITAYSVRIIGCNDSSAYVTQLVTVKDTSSVAGATIVTSADGAGSKVCAGKLVTFNLTGAKKGFDAVLYWYDSNDNLLGQGNPFIMNVTQDTTVYAKYVGECNTTVNSVSKTVEIFEQSDVAMAITLAGDTAQCVGSMADLATLTTRTPLGGTFTGANVAGGSLDVQLGMNVFTYTFNFGTCSFGVNDTIYGIAAPVAQVLTDSIVPNTCSGINVGEFQVEDINNEGLTFTATGGTIIGSIVYTTTTLDSVAEFTGLGAGVYAVTVTNSTGCNVVLPVTISSAAGLTAKIDTANSTLVVCNGADNGNVAILATGGVSPYVYSYDGGANFIASNDTTGLDGSEALNIVVKDASGCTFTVGAGSVLMNTNSVSLTLENIVKPTCYDALDGRFDAVASGAFGPYMYSLDGINFQSASRFDNLSVDVYTVTVKNALGCTRNFISPLLGPDSISVVRSIVSGDPINGYEVLFTVSGGNGGFEISINGGAFGTTFQLSQPAGAYNYVVRDVNGCTKSGSYELDGVDGINNVDAALSSVYPNPFTNTLTLVGNGIENATVIFTDLNGKTINVSIESSNEKVVISTSDVASGIYLVKVITENGSAVKRVIKN